MEFNVLGQLAISDEGRPIALGSYKQRSLLALLLIHHGWVVSTDRIIEELWGDEASQDHHNALWGHISSLRSVLEPDRPPRSDGTVVLTRHPGYLLDIEPQQIDAVRFEQLLADGRALVTDDPDGAATTLRSALALWRGGAYEDVAYESFAQDEIHRLEELRLEAVESRIDADIGRGLAGEVVAELETLIRAHPLRERFTGQLMVVLHRTGRQAEALHAYQQLRTALGHELGLEPGIELRQLADRIIVDDPTLHLSVAADGHGSVGTVPARARQQGGQDPMPSGLVTFVLTDLQGSTRLWRSIGDRFPPLLQRHRELLRTAWGEHDGHEFRTEGDSALVAFGDPAQAVQSCVRAQQLMAAEPWPEDAVLRVRIGVHLGLASPSNGDYVAYAVHQTARVVDAGHGGQIIVTDDVARALPSLASIDLRSHGRFQVRDFDDPIELFEVRGAGMQVVDRQLRVLPADGHNLARPPGAFIGRERELALLDGIVSEGTIVVVLGPGGVGKTRLAIEFGLRATVRMPGGVWFVPLDAIDSIDLVPGAILDAVAVRTPARSEPWDAVAAAVGVEQMLLILDNCEHLLPELAARVVGVMSGNMCSAVLATSRTALGLRGERQLTLGPLTGDPNVDRVPPAVSLFVDRAPTLADVPADPAAFASILALCEELDSLPLAIELAAARAGVQTPDEILGTVLRGRPLRGQDPTLPQRHRTLEATLEWSYRLLDGREQVVLRRLSALPGAFNLDTAVAAAGGDGLDADAVPEAIWSLVDQSLVVPSSSAGSTRYHLLRVIRRFAADRRSVEEWGGVVARLSDRYLSLFGPEIPLDRSRISRLDQELDNIRALVGTNVPGTQEIKQRLAVAIGRHHDMTGRFVVGVDEIRRLVSELPEPTPTRVALLTRLADLELRLGGADDATRVLDDARRLSDIVGRPEWDDAGIDRTAGEIALRAGDHDGAARIAESAMRWPLSPSGRARIDNLLGIIGLQRDDLVGARSGFEAELAAWTDLGYDVPRASTLGNLAETALRQGRIAEAAAYQRQCLEVAEQVGHATLAAFSIIVAARIAANDGDWRGAVRLQTAADAMLRRSHYVLYDFDEDARARLLDEAERHLGSRGVEQARADASRYSAGDAVTAASQVLGAASAACPCERGGT